MTLDECAQRLDDWAIVQFKVPVARTLGRFGISATQLNVAGLLGSLISAVLLALGAYGVGGALFIFSAALDAVDGTVARLNSETSHYRLGAWYDAYFGSISESAAFIGLSYSIEGRSVALVGMVTLVSSLLVSHSKATAGEYGIQPDWREVRVVGRGMRIVLLTGGVMWASVSERAAGVLLGTFLVLLAFNVFTLSHRIKKILRDGRREAG